MENENPTEKILQVFLEDSGSVVSLSLTPEIYARAENDIEFLRALVYGNSETQNSQTSRPESLSLVADSINDTSFIWRNEGVLLLLTLYEEIKEQFDTKRHKSLWADIARKMNRNGFEVTAGQCRSKINCLKRTYKKIKDHNNQSGNERAKWPFYERMTEIFGNTAWVQPLALASELGPFSSSEASPSGSQSDSPSPGPSRHSQRKRRLDNKNEEYRKEKEEQKRARFQQLIEMKQKQHQEKMDIIKLLISRNSS